MPDWYLIYNIEDGCVLLEAGGIVVLAGYPDVLTEYADRRID